MQAAKDDWGRGDPGRQKCQVAHRIRKVRHKSCVKPRMGLVARAMCETEAFPRDMAGNVSLANAQETCCSLRVNSKGKNPP